MSTLVGRVVDRNGQPCEGVRVAGTRVGDDAEHPKGSFAGISTRGGLLEIGEHVQPGRWRLRVADPWSLVEPEDALLDVTPGGCRILLVVEAPSVGVSGMVVDELGAPIGGVAVMGPDLMPDCSTGADGRFTAYRAPEAAQPTAQIEFQKPGRSRVTVRNVLWGEDELRVVMPAAIAIEVLVVDDATGEAIPDFDLLWLDDRRLSPLSLSDRRVRGPHRHGRVILECSRHPRGRITAIPTDGSFFPPPLMPIDAQALASGTRTIRVQRLQPVRISVENEAGIAIPGAAVTVAAPLDEGPFDLLTALVPLTRRIPLDHDAFVVARRSTDSSGEVTLPAPRGPFCLRADADGYASVAIRDAQGQRESDGLIHIQLRSAATLSGTLSPPTALPDQPFVLVGGPRGKTIASAPVDEHGAFAVSDLPQGHWTIMLASRVPWGQARVLGEVEVRSIREHCSFDISQLAESRVEGHVRIGDEVPRLARVALLPAGVAVPQASGISFRASGSRHTTRQYANEAHCTDGRFTMRVQAGSYTAKIGVRNGQNGWSWFDCPDVLQVTPGTCALDVSVPMTTLMVALRSPAVSIAPLVGTLVGPGYERSFGLTGTGAVPVAGVPIGSYTLIVHAGDRVLSLPVEATRAPATVTVDLR